MNRSTNRRRATTILAALGLTAALAVPALAATEIPVITGSKHQTHGHAASTYYTWSEWSKAGGWILMLNDGGNYQGSRNNTFGLSGTFSNYTEVVFQEISSQSGSEIVTVEADTLDRGQVGPANTKFWEFFPSASGDWVLFGRNNVGYGQKKVWHRIVLVDRSTSEKRTIAEKRGKNAYLIPNEVGGSWATYETCTKDDCDAFIYDAVTENTDKLPDSQLEYGAAVSVNGTVYFVRSGNGCGKNVRIYRIPSGGGAAEIIHTLPGGIDTWDMTVAEDGLYEDLYFTRTDCDTFKGDVYKIDDAAGIPAMLAPSAPEGADEDMTGAGADRAARMRAALPGLGR